MDASLSLPWLTIPLQILVVDLLLGADNALLIGLACRALPPEDRKRATALGVAGAIGLRLFMTMVATSLLALPLVKLIGAILLMMIALNIGSDEMAETSESTVGDSSRLWAAAAVIVIGDAAMSVDNVVALAAIAQGSFLWLLIGVGLSLPMLGYAGLLAAQWLHRAPWLVALGAALLGWIAGEMAISDALWANWAGVNAPGLVALAPLFGAAFVYLHGRLIPRIVSAPAAPRVLRPTHVTARPEPTTANVSRPEPLAPIRDLAQEEPHGETPNKSRRVEERVVIVGVLLLALVAGAFIAFVTLYGGLE